MTNPTLVASFETPCWTGSKPSANRLHLLKHHHAACASHCFLVPALGSSCSIGHRGTQQGCAQRHGFPERQGRQAAGGERAALKAGMGMHQGPGKQHWASRGPPAWHRSQ